VGKTLVILDPEAQVIHIEFLNSNIHAQPEGLAFNKKHSLFISNEGKGLVAKILEFQKE
jgi:hypothetical protein